MKKFLLIPLVIIFLNTGCEKEPSIEILNIAPQAFAGTDFRVKLPADSATLNGSFYDTPSDIVHHSWKKISGPSSYVIEKPGSLQTKVLNLVQGVYEFELSVTDKGGLTGKDTVTLYVHDPRNPGSNEFIFKNLKWIYPWYATIEVQNINAYISANSTLKVFVQRGFDFTWTEAKDITNSSINNLYEYFIETRKPDGAGMYNYGSLYIFYYGTNTTDTPNVKIQF